MDIKTTSGPSSFGKGALAIVLVLAIVVVVACAFVVMQGNEDSHAASKGTKFEIGDLTYKIISTDPKEVEVNYFRSGEEHVTIPSTVSYKGEDYTVTTIGGKAFAKYREWMGHMSWMKGCSIYTIELPETLKLIKTNAFYGTYLKELTIPASVEVIQKNAFYQNKELTKLTILGENTELKANSLKLEGLVSLTMPIGLDVVADDGSVFGQPSTLTSIHFTAGSGFGHDYAAKKDSSDDNYSKTVWHKLLQEKELNITLDDGIKNIGNYMFCGCKLMPDIELPSSIETIGDYALSGCSMETFEFPSKITMIGEGVFSNCTNLKTIVIPESISQVPESTFEGCTSLSKPVLHDGIASIGGFAFKNCPSLTEFEFPNDVIQIGRSTFENTGLQKIVIPDSITTLFESTFKGCDQLTHLTIPVNVNAVVKNKNPAFEGCINIARITFSEGTGYSHDYGDSTYTPWNISQVEKRVTFEPGIRTVGDNMFKNCKTLIDFSLPSSVTSIGDSAFANCTSIESIILFDNITSIGKNAFDGCTSATKIDMSERINSIGKDAFKGFKFFDKDGKSIKINPQNLRGKVFTGTIENMVELQRT